MKRLVALLFCLLAPTLALADAGTRRTPCGYQQLTSSNLATATKLTVPASICPIVTSIQFSVSGQSVRMRDDNQAPTATTGLVYPAGANPILYEGAIANMQFIQTTAGASIDVLFYK